jgi:hypothetical protein
MEYSSFQRMQIFALLHEWKIFIIRFIQVDLCHFDWKIQLSKQTKRRPTIFTCEITPVSLWVDLLDSTVTMCVLYSYFETRRSRTLVILLICLAVTLLRYQRHAHAVMFLLSFFVPSEKYYCTLQRAIVHFGWNEKARWVTQRALVLLFAITWRTILQSNDKDLLGCYVKPNNQIKHNIMLNIKMVHSIDRV